MSLSLKKILAPLVRYRKNKTFYKEYSNWVDNLITNKDCFVTMSDHPYKRETTDTKIYAFYLTQYHPIPENDSAHGKGFTEWTNVASAFPQFVGHYQPKIPYDLGFYNLLTPGVMERQAELAKWYGIYGFCFYYYWFSGRKLLEKPLEYFLHSDIDIHFHLCWATENWSKRWDGGKNEIIVEQTLMEDSAEAFFNDLLPYILDPRYEKINDKPVLIIYRVDMFEKEIITSFISKLESLAISHGFAGLHILCTNAFGFNSPFEYKCSGLVEFPPHGIEIDNYFSKKEILCEKTDFNVVNMSKLLSDYNFCDKQDYPLYKTCFPGWDNTPRKAYSNGLCFLMTSNDFRDWLYNNIIWTRQHHEPSNQIVYINAWNEWGEGAILEPTTRFGYKFLNIVKQVLLDTRSSAQSSADRS